MKILLADDDTAVADVVAGSLRQAGHLVDVVGRGDDVIWMVGESEPDLLILDVQMPGGNGFDVCRQLRDAGAAMPILMLTGRGSIEDRVVGLDAGADDYLAKPFAVDELLARVRAVTRRSTGAPRSVLEVGDLVLDLTDRTLTKNGDAVVLTAKEFAVLEPLMRNAGSAVSRDRLLSLAWDFAFEPESNVVDAYIRLLRKKIDDPGEPSRIEAVRGVGYRFRSSS